MLSIICAPLILWTDRPIKGHKLVRLGLKRQIGLEIGPFLGKKCISVAYYSTAMGLEGLGVEDIISYIGSEP